MFGAAGFAFADRARSAAALRHSEKRGDFAWSVRAASPRLARAFVFADRVRFAAALRRFKDIAAPRHLNVVVVADRARPAAALQHSNTVFIPLTESATWGAGLPGSPVVMAFNDTPERHTVFIVPVAKWSDGAPDTPVGH